MNPMAMTNRQPLGTIPTAGLCRQVACEPRSFLGEGFPKWNEIEQINRNVRRSCNGMMPKVVRLMGWISRDRLFTYIMYVNM